MKINTQGGISIPPNEENVNEPIHKIIHLKERMVGSLTFFNFVTSQMGPIKEFP